MLFCFILSAKFIHINVIAVWVQTQNKEIKTCVACCVSGQPSLVFSTSKDIRLLNVSKPTKVSLLVKDLDDGGAVDFYHAGQLVCWTEHGRGVIACNPINRSDQGHARVVTSAVTSPDGLACDWVTQKLYWTDSKMNRIEVVSLNGQHRKVLVWENIDKPRAIALAPMDG